MYPPINKVLAPNFDPCTFIFVITILQIIIFATELIIGQVYFCGAFVTSNDMAGPSTTCMKWMQAKYTPCIQSGEVWRFFTPALLHAGILHIFTNMVSQTMVGYTCELWWGAWRMAFFYIAVNCHILYYKTDSTLFHLAYSHYSVHCYLHHIYLCHMIYTDSLRGHVAVMSVLHSVHFCRSIGCIVGYYRCVYDMDFV